jgi:hypothetical protein
MVTQVGLAISTSIGTKGIPDTPSSAYHFETPNFNMAREIRSRGTTAAVHHRICRLHRNERRQKCWGTLRKGGICSNRAPRPAVPGLMPTCKIHRRQIKEPAWCKALLECGFQCRELLESEIHGLQLCSRHRETLTTCYFLEVPVEIRCRIYRLLLPNKDVPARFFTSSSLTTRRERVYTAILGVNQQIHDEATRVLYCTQVFSIEVYQSSLRMCNLLSENVRYVRRHAPLRRIRSS